MNKRHFLAAVALASGGVVCGFGLRSLRAAGIPDTNPLYYSGVLVENGQPVTGTRAILINLWADGTAQGTPLCTTSAGATDVVVGRFRVALSSQCKTAINQNKNAWVEVLDGAISVGASKIGAVPYAVEADHAVSADTASAATSASGALNTRIAAIESSALTSVLGSTLSAADEAPYNLMGHGTACLASLGLVDCAVSANRKCGGLGYKAGWFVGESSDGLSRSIVCVK